MPELIDDARFVDNTARMAHRDELARLLGARLRLRTTAEWLADLDAAGIPAGPILSIGEMVSDPQTLAREMVVELDHPVAGRTRALGVPVKLGTTPGAVRLPAPTFGQHTREVLREHGFADAEIDALAAEQAIALG